MKRRSRAGGEQIKGRRRKTPEPKRGNAPKDVERSKSSSAGKETEVARLTRELNEALEQQTATSEVLGVISASRGELEPVFQAMLQRAIRICEAELGALYRFDGNAFHLAAQVGASRELAELRSRRGPFQPTPGGLLDRVMRTKRLNYVADQTTGASGPVAKLGGARSAVCVPMLSDDALVGVIAIYRQEVRPFTDKQIELVKNFAAQAVIAIENTRLLNELRQRTTDLTERTADLTEALEQQTATSEVLHVISSSPGDLEPVFATMLGNAARICDAKFGNIFRWDGDAMHLVATHNTPPAFAEYRKRRPLPLKPNLPFGRMVEAKAVVHCADAAALPAYTEERDPDVVAAVELGGIRTFVAVPMLTENKLIGALIVYRQDVRPFTDKQIQLVKNFAAQAVIAIENARLLNELRQRTDDLTERTADLTEALEQQTATSEVLKTISGSPGDLQPVFASMLENAVRICDAKFGNIYRWDGEALHVVATTHNTPPAYAEARRRSPVRPNPKHILGRMVATKTVVHVLDAAEQREQYPEYVTAVELGGIRTCLAVPMLKEHELIGSISLLRQEVRPFTDKQITLLTNFAAQAVIAIENARLLNELRQSLEQQTATSDVLQVVSSSLGDLRPVFATMLEKAVRICEAKFGTLYLHEEGGFRLVAGHDVPEFIEARGSSPIQPAPGGGLDTAMRTKRTAHLPDLAATQSYAERHPRMVEAVELGGMRTVVAVPMLKDNDLVGVIAVFRREVRPFSDKQVALVENFAAQAVIAIENARLLNELRQRTTDLTERTVDLTEALEQQTATSEVLQVISGSPSDLQPVFATMLEKAVRICDATFGNVYRWDGEALHLVATRNTPPAFAEARRRSLRRRDGGNQMLATILATKTPVHVVDAAALPGYVNRSDLAAVETVELGGVRTLLAVPMLKEGELIGGFTVYRQEVRPFTDKQIELVKNFAAQAVIAIENARLLNELRQSLERQTATSEVLQVISTSPSDLEPVFATMLGKAVSICDAKFGTLYLREGDELRLIATHDVPPAFVETQRYTPFRPAPEGMLDAVMKTGRTVHLADLAETRSYIERDPRMVDAVEVGRIRTVVGVPLLKDKELIGLIGIYRQEVRPFAEKQIALLTSFAAQAVIAIENARLLNELRQSLEQQTATSQVLQVISSSPGELEPVFATMLEKAVSICDAGFGNIYRVEGDGLRNVATHKTPAAFVEALRSSPYFRPGPKNPVRQMMETKAVVHVVDNTTTEAYAEREPIAVASVELGDTRTLMVVPMLKDNELVGAFTLARQEVRPFTDKQITLVTNFAAQAVIAIENERLLHELRERTEQVVKLNQQLEQRVTDQVGEIERMSRLRRFLPPQVADLIVASGSEKQLESHRREITALFCDLRGFTGFTESADAEDVMALAARLPCGHRRNHHQIQRHARTLRW